MASMSTCITVIPTCGLPRRLLSFTPKQPISLPCVIGGVPKRVWDSRVLVARPGGAVESDKLPSDVRKRTMDAVDGCGGRVTIGDVASRAGLNLNQAQKALQALAADADGFLEVSGEGDVLYVFPKDYRSRLGAKSFRIKAEPFFEKAKAAGEYLIRVSFGTALIASIVIVYTTIIALVTSSRSEEDNRGRRGGRSYDSGFTFYFNPVDLFWYWDPYYYRRRRLQADDDKMNFIESVFSFVFGDGDPNQGIEEERWKLIGQYIASNGGVVAAEELAPYLDIDSTEGIKFYQLVSELRSWSVESLMVTKANARMEMRMGAMEKAIEENREAVELRLSSIEGMIQWLAAAWEKKSPAMNVHTVDAVMVAMDGEALGWFQWWESWNPSHSWNGLKIAVTQRFQASSLGNPFQALLVLEQEETVQGFIGQFEKCVGMVKGLEEPFLVEVFLKGLKEEISTEVRFHEPKNLMEAMVKARRVEDKDKVLGKLPLSNSQGYNLLKPSYSSLKFVRDWQPVNNKVADPTNAPKTGSSGWQGRRTFHNLSPVEDDESYILPVLLRFDGQPDVDEEGNILYRFPSLQRTASQKSKRKEYVGRRWADWVGIEKFFKEKKWQFSKTGTPERAMVIGLGGLNLFGVIILGTMLKDMAVAPSSFIKFVADIFPLLQIYAGSFFAIPLVRWFFIRKKNADIEKRNKARQQCAQVLELPDTSLRQKVNKGKYPQTSSDGDETSGLGVAGRDDPHFGSPTRAQAGCAFVRCKSFQ
ncbi:hypothetical protein HKD37_01G000880 [Glycine soja]